MPQKGAREGEGQHPMNLKLAGRVAIVTGGDSGVGVAVCRMLAEEGVRVVIADRQDEKGTAAARAIQQRGETAMFVRTDVSRRAEVNAVIAKTLQAYGQVDILCNIAGPGAQGGQLETTEADWIGNSMAISSAPIPLSAWLSTKVMLVANCKTERDSELPTSKVQARFLNSPPLPN